MSRGSKVDFDVLPDVVFRGRACCRAAHCSIARSALSAQTWNAGCEPRLRPASGRPRASRPCLNRMRTTTIRSRASATPTGGFQHCCSRARSASISLCDRRRRVRRSRAERRRVAERRRRSRRARCGSRLSSSAAILSASNFGCGFGGSGFFGGSGVSAFFWSSAPASWRLSSAPRRSDRASAPAPWRACFGSGFGGSASAASARLLRLGRRRRLGLVGGRRSLASRATFGVRALRPAWLSAFFSTSGFGVSAFGAFLTPLVICEKSLVAEMMSTGSDSGGVAFERLAPANDTAPTPAPPTCRPPI